MDGEVAGRMGAGEPVLRLWDLVRFLCGRGVASSELLQIVARTEPTRGDCQALAQCLTALATVPPAGESIDPLTQLLFHVRYAALLLGQVGARSSAPLELLAAAERRAARLG